MYKYLPSGDSAIIIKTGNEISEDINRKVRKLLLVIESENIDGITDFIPSYNELMVCYDPLKLNYSILADKIRDFENYTDLIELPEPSVFHIPVLYGGEYGPDIIEVSAINNLPLNDVISIHSASFYLVYMLGFTPGFCYLGSLDKRISAPRRKEPRIKIAAGSVGIAETQTGIYLIESPGGWQLIGKTPVRLFDPWKKPEFLLAPGDYIKFFPVNENEYERVNNEVIEGNYLVKVTKKI